jgi:hypothetical protein
MLSLRFTAHDPKAMFREDRVSVAAGRSAYPHQKGRSPRYRCLMRRVTVGCGKPRRMFARTKNSG